MSFMADQGAVNTSAFVPWLTRIQMSFALSGTGPLDTLPVFSDSFFQPKSEFNRSPDPNAGIFFNIQKEAAYESTRSPMPTRPTE